MRDQAASNDLGLPRPPRLSMSLSATSPFSLRSRHLWSTLLLASLALVSAGPVGQEVLDPDDEVVAQAADALETGDTRALLDLAARRVELVLLDQSARYGRGQASLVLRDFFRRYPPERVALAERSVTDDGYAAMGRYWTTSGTGPFALYVGFRRVGADVWLLDALRIERTTFGRTGGR